MMNDGIQNLTQFERVIILFFCFFYLTRLVHVVFNLLALQLFSFLLLSPSKFLWSSYVLSMFRTIWIVSISYLWWVRDLFHIY